MQQLVASSEFSSGINSFGFSSPYSSSASLFNRRESTMSNDSGYLISFPESRRDSSMSNCDVGMNGNSNAFANYVSEFGEAAFGGDRSGNFSGNPGSALFPALTAPAGSGRRESGECRDIDPVAAFFVLPA